MTKPSPHQTWLHGPDQKYKLGKNKTKPPPRLAKYIPKTHLDYEGKPLCKRGGFYILKTKDKSGVDCVTCKNLFGKWNGV